MLIFMVLRISWTTWSLQEPRSWMTMTSCWMWTSQRTASTVSTRGWRPQPVITAHLSLLILRDECFRLGGCRLSFFIPPANSFGERSWSWLQMKTHKMLYISLSHNSSNNINVVLQNPSRYLNKHLQMLVALELLRPSTCLLTWGNVLIWL